MLSYRIRTTTNVKIRVTKQNINMTHSYNIEMMQVITFGRER